MNRRDFTAGLALAASSSVALSQAPASRSAARAPSASQAASPGKIGLALGAGSARGFAHIGVLKALDEAGFKADVVAGTSAGSLVGVFYAAGFTPWQMEEVALKLRDVEVADFSSASKRGMFAGEALQKLVNDFVKGVPMERLKLPFAAVASNLKTGETVTLRTGDTGAAVRASCSIPGVFVPAVIGGVELVDGSLVSPLPVKAARSLGADFVIGVDVGSKPSNNVHSGLYEVLLQSFEIMGRSITALEAQTADFMIRPDTLRFVSTDFSARKDLIQAGYEAGLKAVGELRTRLGTKGKRRG
jgi:NTE family protein